MNNLKELPDGTMFSFADDDYSLCVKLSIKEQKVLEGEMVNWIAVAIVEEGHSYARGSRGSITWEDEDVYVNPVKPSDYEELIIDHVENH